jgi:hypothetical protein
MHSLCWALSGTTASSCYKGIISNNNLPPHETRTQFILACAYHRNRSANRRSDLAVMCFQPVVYNASKQAYSASGSPSYPKPRWAIYAAPRACSSKRPGSSGKAFGRVECAAYPCQATGNSRLNQTCNLGNVTNMLSVLARRSHTSILLRVLSAIKIQNINLHHVHRFTNFCSPPSSP